MHEPQSAHGAKGRAECARHQGEGRERHRGVWLLQDRVPLLSQQSLVVTAGTGATVELMRMHLQSILLHPLERNGKYYQSRIKRLVCQRHGLFTLHY